ncbi:hypothetical protein IWZ03DRAFT_406645 [Phyllosticta citriasiana]|uniref:Uncharacterized protein n=1 Tax=Phyllosticta citriasiana TaxID=595635 RepID=A0ABR1KM45_9PEZI
MQQHHMAAAGVGIVCQAPSDSSVGDLKVLATCPALAFYAPNFLGERVSWPTPKSIIPLLLLLALATLSTRLFSLPLNRVIQSRYCAVYYHSPSPPEALCKIDWVQRRLAWLKGVIETAVIGVDLGVAVPAAWVGDRWREKGRGRRTVLAANLLGWAGVVVWVVIVGHLEGVLPVSAMAAAPFFALIGGHDCLLNSAVFAIVTDLTDDLDVLHRLHHLGQLSVLVAALLLYALGSALPVFTMALVDAVDRGDGGGDGDGDAEEQTERRASGVVRHEENDEDAATQASPSASPSPRRIIIAAASSETRPSNSSATARVYTVVMVVKTIGSLVGAPLMTAVWVAGIGVGGAGLGLPFWGSAALYLCAMGVIWCLKL